MEFHTSSQKPSGEKDHSRGLPSQISNGKIRNMSDFAKALRGNMAASRCSVEVPASWSAPEDLDTEFNDDPMEPFSSFESTAASIKAFGETHSTTMEKTPKPQIVPPENETHSRFLASTYDFGSASEPGLLQSFAIPEDWGANKVAG
ncbi:hypothetical protein AC578_1739 [Pseudocercospora eumusae]|uniref:Uncharacterized protein n=1 Tax=Pseudocercospora eumusae TaxID=321146 RepID=A0A139H056_9PEZI|nr:hypothetical protein AC578_1739 [Pseudocercospora eumusae]